MARQAPTELQLPPAPAAPPGPARQFRRRLTAALTIALVAGGLVTAAAPAQAAESYFCSNSTQPYVPVATVESYAAGHAVSGLSVTNGTTPEAFTGTYVGFIADGLGTRKDLLLFRLSSPTIDGTEATGGLKGAGIWAGMSGSPVYDEDGRLIGAVAYSLNFENLPIAGVTPAEYMKSIGSSAVSSAAKVRATAANLKVTAAGLKVAGANLNNSSFNQVKTVNIAGKAGAKQNAFINTALARTPGSTGVASFLRSKNFLPAASTSPAAVTQPLVAGGSIAATYTSGDLLTGAIGTVTAICGDTVWAFGHPMAFEGESKMLMSNVSTAMIVPDGAGFYGSYKQLSQIGSPVGMITQDRQFGIRGSVGTTTTFPITVAVQNSAGAAKANYQVAVAEPTAAASTVYSLIGTAAYEQLDQFGAGSAAVTWTINYRRANGETASLTNSQVVSDPGSFPYVVGSDPAADIAAIVNNEFEDVSITSVAVTLKLTSASTVSYRPSGVQVFTKGKWNTLQGARLKAGLTYSFRPAFKIMQNGKPSGTRVGSVAKIKLKSTARTGGTFAVTAANQLEESCTTDAAGNTTCTQIEDTVEAASFDELMAILDDLQPNSGVIGTATYRLKKGSVDRAFQWTLPGVVTGTTTATFTIRK